MAKTLEEAKEMYETVFGGKIPHGLCVCELEKDGKKVGFGLERTKEEMSKEEMVKASVMLKFASAIGIVKTIDEESRGHCTGNYIK